MRCADAQELVHAYIDGELDLLRSLEIERHLRECSHCATALEKHQALRTALRRGGDVYETMPATLRLRLGASPVSENGQALKISTPAPTPAPVRGSAPSGRWWMGLAAAILATAAVTWQLVPPPRGPSPRELLADEIINDHVRSLQADHLTDIETSDRHTVKPWFNGKLDFAPAVADFTAEGFPLVGGRLDYLNGRPVAALVYRRQKHVINVFAWPSDPAEPAAQLDASISQRGYHTIIWHGSDGLTWSAISDVSPVDLERLVSLLRESPATTKPERN